MNTIIDATPLFDICDKIAPQYDIKNHYMYMHSNNNNHSFKNITTREYIQITAIVNLPTYESIS